ncbi:DUF6711 family protein [Clostridium culturomicium]|uniref:DUF6711 family protein n=1 Tax=Clostridium culturomicium TaxID=1499683 RepID=UPI003857C04D
MYKIDGVVMPTPKIFKVNIADIDGETNRNANGDLMRDRLTTKRKIELEYPLMDPTDISKILKAISPVFVTVEYPDPQEGTLVTKTMYAGDKSAPIYRVVDGKVKWEGLTFNLIER